MDTPLRRRENDSVTSPLFGRNSNSNNSSNNGTTSYGIGEMPVLHNRSRRASNKKNSLVQWTMKGVLLSPVLVLAVWSVCAVSFHRSQQQLSPAQGAVRVPVRPKKMPVPADVTIFRELPATGSSSAGAVYREFPVAGESSGAVYREFPASGESTGSGAVYREFPSAGESGSVYREFPSAGESSGAVYREFPVAGDSSGAVYREFPASGESSGAVYREFPSAGETGAVYREFPSAGESSGAVYREFPSAGDSTKVYREFPASSVAADARDLGPAKGGATIYREFPAQGSSLMEKAENAGEGVLEVMEAALGSTGSKTYIPIIAPLGKSAGSNKGTYIPIIAPLGSTTGSTGAGDMVVQPPNVGVGQPVTSAHGYMKSHPRGRVNEANRPHPRASNEGSVQVYYYDPAQAVHKNGEMVIPTTVYDASGKAISTKKLGAKEILVEPPMGTPSTNATPVVGHKKESSMNRMGSVSAAAIMSEAGSAGSSFADQSILIGTVGVMALLVGAITARRLRSRNILSACIENEALEDDVAYDTAYTVNSDSYNTFSQGWKGDLEKFDV